jgi:hypothetical protein
MLMTVVQIALASGPQGTTTSVRVSRTSAESQLPSARAVRQHQEGVTVGAPSTRGGLQLPSARAVRQHQEGVTVSLTAPGANAAATATTTSSSSSSTAMWLAIGLGVIAVAEAIAIVVLSLRRRSRLAAESAPSFGEAASPAQDSSDDQSYPRAA